jgi:hypothetical protein
MKILFFENVKFKVHFSICNSCKRFAAQSTLIGENAKNANRYINAAMVLEKKNNILKMMI